MAMTNDALAKLRDALIHAELDGPPDETLQRLLSMAGAVLSAGRCSITLLNEKLTAEAAYPQAAFGTMPPIYSPESNLSGNIKRSNARITKFEQGHLDMQAHIDPGPESSMFSTITMEHQIIGVVHVYYPLQRCRFSSEDLHLFTIITPLIAKTVQVIQLQNILNSRFAQIALMRSGQATIAQIVLSAAQNPNHVARLLAKSFYREMTNAGFDFNQILYAASEVISELTNSLRKHGSSRRRPGGLPDPANAPGATAAGAASGG
jgi:hypothetical protein